MAEGIGLDVAFQEWFYESRTVSGNLNPTVDGTYHAYVHLGTVSLQIHVLKRDTGYRPGSYDAGHSPKPCQGPGMEPFNLLHPRMPVEEQEAMAEFRKVLGYGRDMREGFPHLRDGLGIEAGCRQFVVRGGSDVCQAAILFEQTSPFDLTDADDLIQSRGHKGFAAQLAMECDRKSMGLVTNALHEMGGRRVRTKHNGVFSTGQENPFIFLAACLGQSNNCQVSDGRPVSALPWLPRAGLILHR